MAATDEKKFNETLNLIVKPFFVVIFGLGVYDSTI